MKFYSLFSGVGGFELGMMKAGHECVGACEIDEFARETYIRNLKPTYIVSYDAKDLSPESLPHFDVLCGGFPCQAFSLAGKRDGFTDTRGTLFFDIIRIAKEKRPSLLFLENVRGLLFHNKGETFRIMLNALDEVGYDVEWQIINSKYFVPQTRERLFIIGHLRGRSTRKVFPLGDLDEEVNPTELKQVANIDTKGHNSLWGRVYDPNHIAPSIMAQGGGLGAKTGLFVVNDRGRLRQVENSTAIDANYYKGADNHGQRTLVLLSHTKANIKERVQGRDDTWTLDTSGGKMGIEVGKRVRRLMPIECERLQGFPDNWTKGHSDTQRYKQMGNAVTVPVVEYIAKHLYNSMLRV